REPLATLEVEYPRLYLRVIKTAAFHWFLDSTYGELKKCKLKRWKRSIINDFKPILTFFLCS
ncbi:MAG TPA: hypothetical protein DDW42_09605, partial [Desulfobacteraceae bacterium]|nr:hypothetical protein [Desulfobacteraceae bacterium]